MEAAHQARKPGKIEVLPLPMVGIVNALRCNAEQVIETVLFLPGASTILVAILHFRLCEIDLLSISMPDRALCLAGRCVVLLGDGYALARHVLGHLVLVGLRDQVNRYEGNGGHHEYVEGYRERGARRLKQPD